MPVVRRDGVSLHFEVEGPADGRPLLLISGLGNQLVVWHRDACAQLVAAGFRVVRFDNRDVGLSSRSSGPEPDLMALFMARLTGRPVAVHYTLSDMAADAIAVLDAVDVAAAHVVGVSMGAMVAQLVALEHRDRVRSLTSVMATTGAPDVGQPDPALLPALLAPRVDRVADTLAFYRRIAGPHFDEALMREVLAEEALRGGPPGMAHQLAAVLSAPDRTEALRSLALPTLVVHGRIDPLVTVSGGEATARAVPDAELVVVDEMGHELPRRFWPLLLDRVTALADRA